MCVNNNTGINNKCRRLQNLTAPFKIPYGHAKEFLWNLQTIWARSLKKVRQPWTRPSVNFQKAMWTLFIGFPKWLEGRSGYGSSVNVSCGVSSGKVYFVFWNCYICLGAKGEEFLHRPIEDVHVEKDSVT